MGTLIFAAHVSHIEPATLEEADTWMDTWLLYHIRMRSAPLPGFMVSREIVTAFCSYRQRLMCLATQRWLQWNGING